MQIGHKLLTILALAGMIAMVEDSAVAQAAFVNLVAVLPERLSLTINPQPALGLSFATGGAAGGDIAASITISWALLPGRAEVSTWAHVVDASPVLLAQAADRAASLFGDAWHSSSADRFPLNNRVFYLKIGATNLTERDKTSAHTLDLPLAIRGIRSIVLPQDPAGSVVMVQVQTVP